MKNYILVFTLITFIFLCSCLNVSSKRGYEKDTALSTCQFNSLKSVLQDLGICLNIDAKKWVDTLNVNSAIATDWRYFYDTAYFKAYKINNNIPCENLFLLEVSINHGSGEYDNYIIKKGEQGYQIIIEFKGYLYDIFVTSDDYKLTYQFNVTADKSCLVTGKFDGHQIRTDSILSNDSLCKSIFIKGKPW